MGAGERKNKSYAIDRYPDLKEQKLKEQQALNEMLGVNLSTVPTPDLVRELCSRDGIECATINCDDGPAMTIVIHNYRSSDNTTNRPSANLQECEDRRCQLLDGIVCRATNNDSCPPTHIIVVRGDE